MQGLLKWVQVEEKFVMGWDWGSGVIVQVVKEVFGIKACFENLSCN